MTYLAADTVASHFILPCWTVNLLLSHIEGSPALSEASLRIGAFKPQSNLRLELVTDKLQFQLLRKSQI